MIIFNYKCFIYALEVVSWSPLTKIGITKKSFFYEICLILLGEFKYTLVDPTDFSLGLVWYIFYVIVSQYLLVDIYIYIVHLCVLNIMLLIWCIFYKLPIYFWISIRCRCIETSVEPVLA